MKISQDVREYASKQGISDMNEALSKGMKDKSDEFKQQGNKIYSKQ